MIEVSTLVVECPRSIVSLVQSAFLTDDEACWDDSVTRVVIE